MQAKKLQAAALSTQPVYIEDTFSTYLYTGNGSTQTITNGIDLAGEGGLVWTKGRALATWHGVEDTQRGAGNRLFTNATDAQNFSASAITAFNSNGYSIGSNSDYNGNGNPYVSWTFRKAPKFFDVVTYTGDGTAPRNISHNLGSSPGFIVIKRTDSAGDWWAWHTSIANKNIYLNYTDAADTGANPMISAVSFTNFTLATNQNATMNSNGATYVAYLFAHDAGGFGDSGTENVISCGSFTTDGSGNATVNLGYEPQWLLQKSASGTYATGNWFIADSMRGMPVGAVSQVLRPNLSDAESAGATTAPSATGFSVSGYQPTTTYIYIAIRRGPMKTPTTGTEVYSTATYTGFAGPNTITTAGFPPDLVVSKLRSGATYAWGWFDKLRGVQRVLESNSTAPEATQASTLTSFNMDGYSSGTPAVYYLNGYVGDPYINYFLRRAHGFFDEVCYTGTGVARTVSHNLGVVPELLIIKKRAGSPDTNWDVNYGFTSTTSNQLALNLSVAASTNLAYGGATMNAQPTTTTFAVTTVEAVNGNTDTYVAYLFASLPDISKVFSYTGNGSSQTIDCGFTGGARFVLIKRTDSTGDWYVWDSARGIVAGNDPHLSLNTTAAEVTTDDSVDTDSTGFVVNQLAATNINVNAATYIGLAIA